ncbi:hypothetical protein GIB67_028975 [Kingdonia uniflora]|uniref:RING-type E3 ubiquitin transferase n=1 Tax=Kingdonia uniflora TaxID=39325 RepID=A0A7J7LCA4_9MAGN|nr:hypothetical protein GIB67_028975 [Kingdonia uniflora]
MYSLSLSLFLVLKSSFANCIILSSPLNSYKQTVQLYDVSVSPPSFELNKSSNFTTGRSSLISKANTKWKSNNGVCRSDHIVSDRSLFNELEGLVRSNPNSQLYIVKFMQGPLWEKGMLKADLKKERGLVEERLKVILTSLNTMEFNAGIVDHSPPETFICPLSNQIMVDPVILTSGVDHTISLLLSPLIVTDYNDTIQDLQEDLIAIVFNILHHEDNIITFAKNPDAVIPVIEALSTGNANTQFTVAAIILKLSIYTPDRVIIADSEELKSLLHVVEKGYNNYPEARITAVKAVFNQCVIKKNRLKAIKDGAVRVILKKISDGLYAYELWAILRMLSMHRNAAYQIIELNGVHIFLNFLRKSSEDLNSDTSTEDLKSDQSTKSTTPEACIIKNCMTVLNCIISKDKTKFKEIKEEERTYKTISWAFKNGTGVTPKWVISANENVTKVRILFYDWKKCLYEVTILKRSLKNLAILIRDLTVKLGDPPRGKIMMVERQVHRTVYVVEAVTVFVTDVMVAVLTGSSGRVLVRVRVLIEFAWGESFNSLESVVTKDLFGGEKKQFISDLDKVETCDESV